MSWRSRLRKALRRQGRCTIDDAGPGRFKRGRAPWRVSRRNRRGFRVVLPTTVWVVIGGFGA